jgi:hypothetical protein
MAASPGWLTKIQPDNCRLARHAEPHPLDAVGAYPLGDQICDTTLGPCTERGATRKLTIYVAIPHKCSARMGAGA